MCLLRRLLSDALDPLGGGSRARGAVLTCLSDLFVQVNETRGFQAVVCAGNRFSAEHTDCRLLARLLAR